MNQWKALQVDESNQRVEDWLNHYRLQWHFQERGEVLSIGDGITWVSGLPNCELEELLHFADSSFGFVFELARERVGVILLHQESVLIAGTSVFRTHRTVSIPIGNSLLGRVIDPLGNPLDDKPQPETVEYAELEQPSPTILQRNKVNQPLYTGNKIIDTLIPIGKGQRQLIVGDKGLGRSALALDAVLNQKGKGIRCVYVLIGQKRSSIVNTINVLKQHGALEYCTVVVAQANALPGQQFLAPFAGCAVAEYWMKQGKDTLVVYDDLSTHAKTYRELSLLLQRPPGREAYPGDIFYLHARLLERATCLNAEQGGGSLTALPIIETQMGEIASYIPTNLISISDGQIYLQRELFVGGFRPAIDIARSVSRIGGQAQHPLIKEEASAIKLKYLQFLELEVFTRFGAKLEASMEASIQHGRVLRELLKQSRFSPLSPEQHIAWLIAFNEGLLDDWFEPDCESDRDFNRLMDTALNSGLSLDSPRQQWLESVRRWLVKE